MSPVLPRAPHLSAQLPLHLRANVLLRTTQLHAAVSLAVPLCMLAGALLSSCSGTLPNSFSSLGSSGSSVTTKGGLSEIKAGQKNEFNSAFPDVPVAEGHRIDLERSLVFTSPHQTIGKLTTEGPGDVNSLYNFYQNQMTSKGWSLVNAFRSSTASLYFAKPGKFVAIIIEADGSRSSRVMLSIGPE